MKLTLHKQYTFLTSVFMLILLLSACSSTNDTASAVSESIYPELQVFDNLMEKNQISGLFIYQAKYPIKAAKKSVEGCVSIEYVITEAGMVDDIRMVASSNPLFDKEAISVVKRAQINDLRLAQHSLPIKLRTRFDFCLNESDVSCEEKAAAKICPAGDTLYSRGFLMRVKERS